MKASQKETKSFDKFSKLSFYPPVFLIFLTIFINCVSASSILQFVQEDSDHSVSLAIVDVIRTFLIANNLRFDFIIYGQRTRHIDDVIDKVSKELSEEISVNITHIGNINQNLTFSKSFVIFTKSKENLLQLHECSTRFFHDNNIYIKLKTTVQEQLIFVVYTEEVTSLDQIKKISDVYKNHVKLTTVDLRFFEFFIINDRNLVNLAASVLFSENSCGIFKVKLLNAFIKSEQKWEKELQNFEHFEDFHGCMLNILCDDEMLVYQDISSHKLVDNTKGEIIDRLGRIYMFGKETEFHGILNELLKVTAQNHNFINHYAIEEIDHINYRFVRLASKHFVMRLELRIKFFKDTTGIGNWQNQDVSPHQTLPFVQIKYYYLITQNDLYGSYEKLTFAFDETTWMLIFLTYGLTFIVIGLLKKISRRLRIVVFGEGEQI